MNFSENLPNIYVHIRYCANPIYFWTSLCYVLATNGIVLATEKKQKSILYDEHSIHKIEMITKHSGLVYSGMGPDYR